MRLRLVSSGGSKLSLVFSALVAVSTIASVATASSQTCTTVDLRYRMPPVRNQGTTGWCYAAADADFLSFYLGRPVSAVDIAVNYIRRSSGIETSIRRVIQGDHGWSDGAPTPWALGRLEGVGACLRPDAHDYEFNNANALILAGQIGRLNICAGYQRTPPFDLDLRSETEAAGMNLINEELSQQRIVLISYKIKAIYDNESDGTHASTIVGRRYNAQTGTCDYLLRNSWGPTWKDGGYDWIPHATMYRALSKVWALKKFEYER